jgi:hypothetical protein
MVVEVEVLVQSELTHLVVQAVMAVLVRHRQSQVLQ